MTKTICALSDLHGYLPEEVPEADILVVAGDISPLDYDRKIDRVMTWLDTDFYDWITATPTQYRLVIAGNHDFALEAYLAETLQRYSDPEEWQFLSDQSVEVENINFYGLPWVPNLRNWAFYGDKEKLQTIYEAVPEDTDVVISHGPYTGSLLDAMFGYDVHLGTFKQHVGASQANDMLERVKPKAFVCGHIHEGYGYDYYHNQTHCYNVAINNEYYYPVNKPVVFEV